MSRRSLRLSLGNSPNLTEDSHIEPVQTKKRRLARNNSPPYNEDDIFEPTIAPLAELIPKARRTKSIIKKKSSKPDDSTQIENYYLNKTVQNKKTSLETIFEEDPNSSKKLMGKRKIKRFIPFEEIKERKKKQTTECLEKLNDRNKKAVDRALQELQDIEEQN